MRVALTGVSGFIGSYTARALREAGHEVTGLVRETSRRDHIQDSVDRFVVGSHDDPRVWPALVEGADCVIHNSLDWPPLREGWFEAHLKSNLLGSLLLMEASSPRQFIFISTIAVHHDMSPNWHGKIDEEHPLRPGTEYGAHKAAIEAHLWAEHARTGRNLSAIRPCGVYGIDPKLDRSHGYKLIEKIREGGAISKPDGGKFVHVEDVAGAIVACIGNEASAGKPFNLVDCYARWADWAQMACEVMGVEREIDFSSPAEPANTFVKDQARSLGVGGQFLERGHEGIRKHLAELVAAMG